MKTNGLLFAIVLLSVFILTGCAERVQGGGSNDICCTDSYRYGFLGGIWHGIIAPFGLIMMLFNENVGVFASCNNGFWYAFGFLLGSGGWGILASKSKK